MTRPPPTSPLFPPPPPSRPPLFIFPAPRPPHRRRGVLVDVPDPPLLVRRDIPDRRLPNLGPGVEDREPLEHPVRRMVLAAHPGVPYLAPRIYLLHQLRHLHVVELRVPAVGLGLHVVPPHVLLPLAEQPRRLVRHRTGLAGNTPVDVEHKRKLPLGMPLLIGIQHLAA